MNAADAKPKLTEEDGYEALRGHVVDKALAARRKYGPELDAAAILRLLADREVVRFPTELAFDASLLQDGEFAWAMPKGEHPSDGFTLIVHSRFEHRPEALPYLVAYHIPTINYLDVVTNREAELYGAALLGLEVDEYYRRLCALADELEQAPPVAPEPAAHRCNCGAGGCGSR
ncbi:MAG: hypothetical protein EXS08_15925 [Planctomycetes bacterium]|nr:hypothetical protein [Planctomycetota bacterium]